MSTIQSCKYPRCPICQNIRQMEGDTEMSNTIPLREELPRVNYSSKNYRRDSGAWTGYAPRSTEQRWPTPPRAIEPGWFVRLARRIFGR